MAAGHGVLPAFLQPNVFRSDPVLNSDTAGRFFYLSLLQNFFDDLWRSLNGGQSWAIVASADGGDKEWFTIDNSNSPGHGFHTNPGVLTEIIWRRHIRSIHQWRIDMDESD